MPITGGINWPPIDEEFSIAAAVAGGRPALIMAGIVAEPTVIESAAPEPLTVPISIEPMTADCGIACGERTATRLVARSSESMQPNPRSRLKHQKERANHCERDLRQARENAGFHLDAACGDHARPGQAGVIEHAGHASCRRPRRE